MKLNDLAKLMEKTRQEAEDILKIHGIIELDLTEGNNPKLLRMPF